MTGLGFAPVKVLDPALAGRFVRLYHKLPKQEIELRRVLQAGFRGGYILLFDVWDTGGDESGRVGTHVVGFVSPGLRLPRFSLVSRLFYKGKFGELIVGATEWLSEWKASKGGLSRVSFPESAEFELKFLVFGADEAEVRRVLSPARLARLAALQHAYQIEAEGDTFALERHVDWRGMTPEQEITSLLDDAHTFLEIFQ